MSNESRWHWVVPVLAGSVMIWVVAAAVMVAGADTKAGDERSGDHVLVGVATVDITPEGPIRLCGYASREVESEGVAGELRASALAMGGNNGEGPAVLITAELVGVPASLVERLAVRLEKKAGIARARLAVCATHTHTGPCLAGFLNETHFSEYLPADQMARLERYTAHLEERLEEVALAALAARAPARLAWSQGEVGFAINRRRIVDGKWAGFGRVPGAPVDHALPVMTVRGAEDGALRAVLVNYACHCTTFGPEFNRVHGDWAGAAARIIEERHPGSVALISIGCGGDANPDPRGAVSDTAMADAHGKTVADEVDRLLGTSMRALAVPPECRLRRIELTLDHVPSKEELEARLEGPKRPAFYARLLLGRLERGETIPGSFSYPVQTWTFGKDLAMVFLAGEVVVDYALRLKRECDAGRLWVTAYANDAPGYIASKRVIGEGGYEVDDSMNNYDKASRLSTEVEDRIIGTVKELLPEGFAEP